MMRAVSFSLSSRRSLRTGLDKLVTRYASGIQKTELVPSQKLLLEGSMCFHGTRSMSTSTAIFLDTRQFWHRVVVKGKNKRQHLSLHRNFNSEGDYHIVADETLETIQDSIEEALEEANIHDFDVNLASGVLTISMPPHGTWVINKQTPNKQLWWSSPISGPRRYEYEDGDWVYTRDDSHSSTLLAAITEEVNQVYQIELEF
jgi:frataxin